MGAVESSSLENIDSLSSALERIEQVSECECVWECVSEWLTNAYMLCRNWRVSRVLICTTKQSFVTTTLSSFAPRRSPAALVRHHTLTHSLTHSLIHSLHITDHYYSLLFITHRHSSLLMTNHQYSLLFTRHSTAHCLLLITTHHYSLLLTAPYWSPLPTTPPRPTSFIYCCLTYRCKIITRAYPWSCDINKC
jgi:hypothetical protein